MCYKKILIYHHMGGISFVISSLTFTGNLSGVNLALSSNCFCKIYIVVSVYEMLILRVFAYEMHVF